ncbi:2-octaprenylphenol hydroxylase [Candidatus Profftia lariciata]|uniref:FAD-dependent monooxygenase n=1 Tax=Candidatus Profftia lariciata TaxID=1987921 RepID=UPI001D0074CB|nr:FAD-dependent monooxygenase [Candidatus Profftia lariciata]UDG81404.1 2-octaprenylphenol hydroxylase [Candidatus Profftia lariciata]
MQSFDIIISGGGVLGLATVIALKETGLNIALIEENISNIQGINPNSILRVSTINIASECILKHLDVWQDIIALRTNSYQTMEVWDSDSFGSIMFNAEEYGYTHLGHIIENSIIQRTLWNKVKKQLNVDIITPASIKQIKWGDNEALVILNNEQIITARLVIGIDGAQSWLRKHADIPLTFWEYGHKALVATIKTEQQHNNCARQIFHSNSILAFLPLKNQKLCSIVWSMNPQKEQYLRLLSDNHFNREIAVAFDMRLGLCQIVSSRQSYPLIGRYARSFAAHRLALVGDAAHTIHPLAGQGMNLGFMDVAKLTSEIKRLQRQGKDIGRYMYLRSYERSRKYNAAVMLAVMQGFRYLFEDDNCAKKVLRDTGMIIFNNIFDLKFFLVRYAMGLSDVSDLSD